MLLWIFIGLVCLVLLITVLLYVPFIQDFAKDIAVSKLSESTGMEISLDRLRLKFPIVVSLDRLTAVQDGDTLIAARRVDLDVAMLPLFKGQIDVSAASLDDAFYRQNTPDSAFYMTARIDRFETTSTGLGFDISKIDVGPTLLDGADINIVIKDTVTPESPDTAAVSPMMINAPDLRIRNVKVTMRMLPTIDSLYAFIGDGKVTGGRLEMPANRLDIGALSVDSLTATYLTPTEEFLKKYHAPQQPDSVAGSSAAASSAPWTINIGHIRLTSPQALYAMRGAQPLSGLDMNYLKVNGVKIEIDSFYNRATDIRVPITSLQAAERCGLRLSASGTFEMDSVSMRASYFDIATNASSLHLNAAMGLGDMTKDPSVPIMLKGRGEIALSDVYMAMPTLAAMMRGVSPAQKIMLDCDIHGTSGALDVDRLSVDMPRYLRVAAYGRVVNPMDFNLMQGRITLDGAVTDADFIKDQMLDRSTARSINIPPMTIAGTIDYRPGLIDGDVKVNSSGGDVKLAARWNQKAEGYDLNLNARRFPLQRFMPGLGLSDISGRARINGHGYDPQRRSTRLSADIDLDHIGYNGKPLDRISVTAALDTCCLTARLISDNAMADVDADVKAWFTKNGYEWDLSGDVRHLDLKALGLMSDPMNGTAEIYTSGNFNPRNGNIDAELSINNLGWTIGDERLDIAEATARFLTNDSLTEAYANTGDLYLNGRAYCSLDTLMARLDATSVVLQDAVRNKNIDVLLLQRTMPRMNVTLSTGTDNAVTRYLAESTGLQFSKADLSLNNDSLINMQTEVDRFITGSTRLDRINLDVNQKSRFLVYKLAVNNEPGTMDDFAHVDLSGYLAADKFSAYLKQQNIKNEQGFSLGVNAAMSDSLVTVRFVPQRPTIAYKKWRLNSDNYVTYRFDNNHVDADLELSSDSSSVRLFTEHIADADLAHQEDVVLRLKNIKLSEWLSLSPFSPPMKGIVDADIRVRWTGTELTGKGNVNVTDLFYGRERVGTFGLDLDVANDPKSGALRANVGLMVDGVKVITAQGNLNDSTAVHPFLLDFSMIHFPLRVVNPFLPKDLAQMSGMLNGQMDITGDLANPVFNGFLDFDSTAVKLGLTGASYAFSESKIPVDSNVVKFNNFSIAGLNGNNLYVNGTVDARRLSDISLDLDLKARDMQLVNSNRPRGANIYGKAFVDLDATVKGNMTLLRVDADVNILGGTNVTYVMTESVETLVPQASDDMVKFVQFSDTTQVAAADSTIQSAMSILLDARLKISEGTTINVDLSPDGKNRASINGSGSFTYSMTPMDAAGRLTGRYTINSGFVRYTPQLSTGGLTVSIMSEKNFKFVEGSYISFTGDILNPVLSIKAVDRLRANVTQEGQNSRLVNFDIGLSVGGTLSNMNVAFDLSTNDDLTIENELTSMSPEQRANQAMNMLLYNQYTGPGTKANANLTGNPLYSFLAGQLNSWMANNVRGVDISFGIDQYDTTTDGAKSTTTSYSYRVSKSLFNDRFKIVVGGNYSTDADADENFSQNLINDISFEYMLNRSGSMYVRLFRHVGYESILEGEITQTGVGFVIKRKLNTLRDIFRFSPRIPKPAAAAPADSNSVQPSSQN